jgi:hypothetical protein
MLLAAPGAMLALAEEGEGWIDLFDGKTLAGWKVDGNTKAFTVEDGQIVVHGQWPNSDAETPSLIYFGPTQRADFENFELSLEAMTLPGSESTIHFHALIEHSHVAHPGFSVLLAGETKAPKKSGKAEQARTGSLWGAQNVFKPLVKDNEWFGMEIAARGKQVQVRVNGMLVVDYSGPEPPDLDNHPANHGTFWFHCIGKKNATYFRNIRVRRLPDAAGADLVAPIL